MSTPLLREDKRHSAEASLGVALLVDFDNVWFGLHGTGTRKATPKTLARVLLSVAARFGPVALANVYATDPRRISGMTRTFTSEGYVVIVPDSPYRNRNIDVRMALDCHELLFTRSDIGTYVLASGDSDFARLAESIVARQKNLVIVAPVASTSTVMSARAQTFVPLEELFSENAGLAIPLAAQRRPPVQTAPSKSAAPRRPALRVFLCHSKADKKAVRALYGRLKNEPGVQPWLDEQDLLPGQDWELEITRAVKKSHCVIVCLSAAAVGAAGYIHKEIRFALDVADEQREGTIFLIPVKFDECDVPERIRRYHWVDLFKPEGYANLTRALETRANTL